MPVTVVWGTEDRIIPSGQAEAVPGAAVHLLDGAGHMAHMERPAEVQAAIEEAIATAPPCFGLLLRYVTWRPLQHSRPRVFCHLAEAAPERVPIV